MTYEYILTETRVKEKTLVLRDIETGRDTRLHSAYDPMKETRRGVENFSKGKASIILVSGLALGYHIELLKEKYPETDIIILEADKSVISKCIENNPRYKNNRFIISNRENIERIFENIDLAHFKGISHYCHRPSYQLNNDFYEEIIEDIKTYISSKVSDLLTRFEFEKKWIGNIFRNINQSGDGIGCSNFFGKFKDRPGIIVSAGPSLRKNLNYLKKLQDNSVIVCVDTAIKVLDKHGINPHFIMTLDAQKYSQKHFNGIESGKSVLLADIVCCPSVLKSFKGRKVISTTSKYYQNTRGETVRETTPAMSWLEKHISPFGDIQSGGSVATSAFDFILNLGCNRIILMGQDLAYTGREIHCSGTYHNDDWMPMINRFKNLDCINQNVIRKRKIKHIPAYGNKGRVISDFVFDLYKSWFEDSSSRIGIEVINSTDGGSSIKNTVEESIDKFCSESPEISTWNIIEDIFKSSEKISISKINSMRNNCLTNFTNIKKILENNSDNAEKIGKINYLIHENNIADLVDPLLRKINIYIDRNSIEDEKALDLLSNEFSVISEFYTRLFS